MEIVEWPAGVNRIVTTDSSIGIGKNGVKSDSSENGSEMSRLTGSSVPETYTVNMYFSNDVNHPFYKKHNKTEWAAFRDWFKYITKMGVNPFYFTRLDDPTGTERAMYKISSGGLPEGKPNGSIVQVAMTWIQYIESVISVPVYEAEADWIDLSEGLIDLRLTSEPLVPPTKTDFNISYSFNGGSYTAAVLPNGLDWDGYRSIHLYINEPAQPGLYTYKVSYQYDYVDDQGVQHHVENEVTASREVEE